MNANTRTAIVLATLLVTLVATYFAPAAEVVDVPAARRPISSMKSDSIHAARTGQTSADAGPTVLVIQPRDGDGEKTAAELFAARPSASAPSLLAKTPVVPAPVPLAEPPRMPPLPFRVLGSFAADGRVGIFVEYEDQGLIAKVGDTLGGLYRIEALGDTTLTVTYLPLDRQQSVDIGTAASR